MAGKTKSQQKWKTSYYARIGVIVARNKARRAKKETAKKEADSLKMYRVARGMARALKRLANGKTKNVTATICPRAA
jgi:hypothetical protein